MKQVPSYFRPNLLAELLIVACGMGASRECSVVPRVLWPRVGSLEGTHIQVYFMTSRKRQIKIPFLQVELDLYQFILTFAL